MLVIGFSLLAIHLAYFYFRIDYNIAKESLYLPIFIRNAAQVMISTVLLTSITRLPFPFHFTQGVCLHNLFSSALAANIGTAIVGRLFTVTIARNSMWLSEGMDHVNESIRHIPFAQLYGTVQQQAVLESMKEIYGWLLVVAIGCLIALMLRHSGVHPRKVIEPTYRTIYNLMRGEVKLRLRLRHIKA